MRFTALGTGTGIPDGARGPAGFLLRVGERAFLVDGGSGTLERCVRAGVRPADLDGGFYSHRHPDHTGDLVSLLFSMRLPPGRGRDYPIWAGEGFRGFLDGLHGVYGHWITPAGGDVVVHELPLDGPGRVDLGALVVRTLPANHSAGALHLRFEAGGRAVVFSGDTGPSDALADLARGADLLVCECAGSDDAPVPGHLRPSDVAGIVRRARPARVWLTHLYPHVDASDALSIVERAGAVVRRPSDGDTFDAATT